MRPNKLINLDVKIILKFFNFLKFFQIYQKCEKNYATHG